MFQEMNCLQSNYAKLQDVCKTAVQHYSQAQDKDVKLSTTYQNCAPMLAKYCPGLTPQSTFDDAMDCLIPHKEEAEMSKPCAAEIEHYQMVSKLVIHVCSLASRNFLRSLSSVAIPATQNVKLENVSGFKG